MPGTVFRSIRWAAIVLPLLSFAAPVVAEELPAASKAVSPVLKAPPPRWAPDTSGQFWAELDYLNWTVKGDRLPALVTTSPAGTPAAQAGVLGAPGTNVLFGDSSGNNGWRSGGRLQAGYWFDRQQNSGVEASVFGLENLSSGFAASSGGTPILARPFFNTGINQQDAAFTAFPGLGSGSVTVRDLSRMIGAGALYRQTVWSWGGPTGDTTKKFAVAPSPDSWSAGHISVLLGYRYRYVSDRLEIASATTAGPVSIGVSDLFNAINNFHGLDLGLAGDIRKGAWLLEWRGKVALGVNLNDTQTGGATVTSTGGVTTVTPAGLLASPNNIGNNSRTRFAAMPEFAMKLGYQVAPQWQIFGGYDAMYWPGLRRAGDMASAAVAGSPPPGGPPGGRPQMQGDSALLAQGFSFGLKYAY
jgi:hypothetical protein